VETRQKSLLGHFPSHLRHHYCLWSLGRPTTTRCLHPLSTCSTSTPCLYSTSTSLYSILFPLLRIQASRQMDSEKNKPLGKEIKKGTQ
jgi:hypothetical protein